MAWTIKVPIVEILAERGKHIEMKGDILYDIIVDSKIMRHLGGTQIGGNKIAFFETNNLGEVKKYMREIVSDIHAGEWDDTWTDPEDRKELRSISNKDYRIYLAQMNPAEKELRRLLR